MDDMHEALTKRNVPFERLARLAYETHIVLAEVYGEASLLYYVKGDIDRLNARKGARS